ncbi:enoyl-CoA hydratase family member [Bisporella sp. PMI_857]|nr:enoyl-CoA hydratase family member [Bisporella sp. PMI_857]
MMQLSYKSLLYEISNDGKVATIILNRPARFNAIDPDLPGEIRATVRRANADSKVHVIVVKGNGPGFCGGYDLVQSAQDAERGVTGGSQDVTNGYDPFLDYQMMKEYTECYAELFHSHKPTIAQVHGAATCGGTDIALSCDLVIIAEDARIGYTATRVWGCPTAAMWTYRLGPEKAKRMLFTGDLIDGKAAEAMGLVLKAVPQSELDEAVRLLTDRIKTVPINQLWMQKRVVNSIIEGSVASSQQLATIFDGLTRNSPEGIAFQQLAATRGFKQAIAERDSPGGTDAYRKMWRSSL